MRVLRNVIEQPLIGFGQILEGIVAGLDHLAATGRRVIRFFRTPEWGMVFVYFILLLIILFL